MNRLDRVTHSTEALEVEDEMNREWDRKKSKYCCELCERSVNRVSLTEQYKGGPELQVCERCEELE